MAIFSPGMVSQFLVRSLYNVDDLGPPLDPPPDPLRQEVPGYAGLYNFAHHFWVVSSSRVYGPTPHVTLNISQDLCADVEKTRSQPNGRLLLDALRKPESRAAGRVFTALRWYMSAGLESKSEHAAIVDLAIAFEALLGLPPADKSERLVDAIAMLLGRIPRLDVWARQFYDARSQVAHEGEATRLDFIATDSAKQMSGPAYMSLLSYGRVVFRLCVGTLLFGASLAESAGLEERFVTNGERFERISRTMEETTGAASALAAVAGLIETIERYRFIGESDLRIATMIGALRRVCAATLTLEKDLPADWAAAIASMAEVVPDKDTIEQLNRVRRLNEVLPEGSAPALTQNVRSVRSLAEAVWGYTFMLYFHLDKQRKAAVSPGSSASHD